MRRYLNRSILVISLVFATLPGAVLATSGTLYAGHTTWQTALPLKVKDTVTLFGQLGAQGDARVVAFSLSKPQKITFRLGTPEDTHAQFQPQAVVYLPDSSSAGPILPIEQPPGTMALVFGDGSGEKVIDRSAQIAYEQELSTELDIQNPGTVYVAVYNADQVGGRFRLDIVKSKATASLLVWPSNWWRAQTWAGLSARTLVFPFGVLGLLVLIGIGIKVSRRVVVKVSTV